MGLLHRVAPLPQRRDEFLQVLCGEILPRDNDCRGMGGEADRHEVGDGIVFEVRRQHRSCDMRAHRRGKQRIAVGCGSRDARAADRATGAADVLDDDGLAQDLRHLVGDDARHDVAGAAGRERHDHRDRPGGIVLRACLPGNAGQYHGNRASSPNASFPDPRASFHNARSHAAAPSHFSVTVQYLGNLDRTPLAA